MYSMKLPVYLLLLLFFLPCAWGFNSYACEGHMAYLHCPRRQVILVQRANYGRTTWSMCNPPILGISSNKNLGCVSPIATHIMATLCHGQSRCHVSATNNVFGDPCFGTYKYLEVIYDCE